ncbi:hypothetical protein [Nocardia wallacei]|uniref:hypothetical protein n=1 Tax=Nocardia wallacei TaxID=480035 RepID=UPI0024575747|nr:hypothetical protein [Nocardia wallacei]
MTTQRTRFENRTTELDSTRAVWRGDEHGGIRVLSLQVLGGVTVNFGAPSIALDDAQQRWPEHAELWAFIRHAFESNRHR